MKGYTYNKKLKNLEYVFGLIRSKIRDVGGITVSNDKITIWFPRELNSEEKEFLDDIVAKDPEPEEVYEYGELVLDDIIEQEIGIRPILVEHHRDLGHGRIMFDKKLNEDQRKKLTDILKSLKSNSYIVIRKVK